jgi:hypothetical protein
MATTDLYSQFLNPVAPEIMGLERQRQYARMLMQQSAQPQGQMVSGQFVAPSWTQQLNAALNPIVGAYLSKSADTEATKLAKQLRQRYADEIVEYQNLLQGKPQIFEQAGPMPDGGNIPAQMYRGAPNPQAAYLYGSTAYNPVLQQVATKKLTEGPQWKEISQFNQQTGNTENYRYDANSANPRETMQFLGISKPAISPEAQIRFADEGIGVPSQFRGGQPVAQPTSPYGANVQMTPNQPVARPQGQPMGQPVGQPQAVSMGVPTVGGTAPTVASTQQPDPFKAPPPPAGLSGKQLRDWQSDQAKPLTGKPLDEVNGAIGYQKSLNKIQDLFNKYQGPQLLDPNVRAEFKAAVRTAQLTGKEAFGLGVLNGPDLDILEQVISDPTAFDAFLKDRNTLNKLYNNQRMFTAEKIKTNYNSAQKAVPQNLREFVEIKPRELDSNQPKAGQPKTTGRVARAMLGSEPIVVRDGKWVYERTGKAVQ